MEGDMETEMEMEIEPVFEVREIDLDYEFDAPRFFDFTSQESPAEAREAELWFESAPTYSPSPFVKKLVLGDESVLGNVTVSPKCKEVEDDSSALYEYDSENVMGSKFSCKDVSNRGNEGTNRRIFTDIQKVIRKALNQPFQLNTGLTTYKQISNDSKAKYKSVKPFMPRSSTLMKPTASQLAKQNRSLQVAASRFQKPHVLNGDRSVGNSSVVESQAAKRQKLEGGVLHKHFRFGFEIISSKRVDEVKQQITFVHKAPKKDLIVDRNPTSTKLRLTIPREPELETANRAQRIRPKNGTEEENVKSVTRRFKARPLNRKILEAPSLPLPKKSIPKLPEFQEFHLKTSERAVQLSSAVSSSTFQTRDTDKVSQKSCTISDNGNGARETGRTSAKDATPAFDAKYGFKAHPLNKKIFSSKGDIGVFRNVKRETTLPMEFNFHTEKRVPQNPPIELFSKLSLTSELQLGNKSQMRLPRPAFAKGSKENRLTSFQPEHEMRHLSKVKPDVLGGTKIQCVSDGCFTEVGNQLGMRSLDIR